MDPKPEIQALMLETDSGSESDVTEFDPSGKHQHPRSSKNGIASTFRGSRKKASRCTSNNLYCLILLCSAVINVTLIVVVIITSNQSVPSQCPQVPSEAATLPHPDNHNNSNNDNNHNNNNPLHSTQPPPPPAVASAAAAAAGQADPPTRTAATPNQAASPTTPPSPPETDNNVACGTSTSARPLTCGGDPKLRVEPPVDQGYVNVFRDLSSEEISAAVSYLVGQPSLGLGANRSKVFGVELNVPEKGSALSFLDSSSSSWSGIQPPREALVSVVFVREYPPVFRQYVVGPLPRPTYHKANPRMSKAVRLSLVSEVGMAEAYPVVFQQLRRADVEHVLRESFGATTTCTADITAPCLMLLAQKISFGLVNRTSFTFSAYYRADFPTIHPVPFQLIVSETRAGLYVIQHVFYAGESFSSIPDLVARYARGAIRKVVRKYPSNAPGQSSIAGSMNLRGEPFPRTPHPPPRQYEPRGPRYSIVNQHVKYLEWSLNVRNSVESGLQLWDVTWSGERIVYELSLQEIAVLYAGANPAAMFAHLSDSAFGLGDNAKRLVPGVDCPEHASFLSTWIYDSRGSGASRVKEIHNTVCVFEHNSDIPIRRHMSDHPHGRHYGGLTDHYLVVRTIIVEYNYDYIVDVVLHGNGALETRAYATGYIMSQWFHYGEDPFGFRVHEDVVGSIHHHLFHFKVDMDVGGVRNRYETLDFAVDDRDWPWLSALKPSATTASSSTSTSSSSSSSSSRSFQQISFKHHVRRTEKDALYHYDFDHPKYHIFYTENNKNKFGNSRAYRIAVRGFSKQLLPDAHPVVRSRKWMQHCMAVTERKEDEAKSSSIFSMYDADDPVVDFDNFLKDDGDIVDKDLVVWVTVGMHHIPHTEDIPNTPTVGTEASILLLPFNYFPEDPSMRSRDAVRADWNTKGGATSPRFQTYGTQTDFTCVPPVYGWLSQSTSAARPWV